MANLTVKEVTNAVAGQDGDHVGGTDWNQLVQAIKGTYSGTDRIQQASVEQNIRTVSSTYSVAATDNIILCDATSGAFTITLPDATVAVKASFTFKKIDVALTNAITIATFSGQTIDGLSQWILSDRGERLKITSDGSNWRVIQRSVHSFYAFQYPKGSTLNRFMSSPADGTALTTATVVANTLYALPIVIEEVVTFDQIGFNVTTLGSGSSARVGIYTDNGNNSPSSLVSGSDTGAIATTATGFKTGTFSSPITLQPGLYWVVIVVSATAPVVSGFAVGNLNILMGYSAANPPLAAFGWSVSFTFGALPSTFPASPALITAAPLPWIGLRSST